MNGSLLDGGTSFVITIPSFVANFKRNKKDSLMILKYYYPELASTTKKYQSMVGLN